jgi:hypothetical protein
MCAPDSYNSGWGPVVGTCGRVKFCDQLSYYWILKNESDPWIQRLVELFVNNHSRVHKFLIASSFFENVHHSKVAYHIALNKQRLFLQGESEKPDDFRNYCALKHVR